MALRRSDWPLTGDQLRHVIALGETALVEFKREWWNMSSPEGRAKLARAVIALANVVGKDELAIIVFGVDDERRGGAIVPVKERYDSEAIVQILSGYIHPPANIACRDQIFDEGIVSCLAVMHSPARPHYSLREYPAVLSQRDVYVRRDDQVGVLTPPELEQLIREKDAAFGPLINAEPLQFGFVGIESTPPRRLVFRVANVVARPVFSISVLVDASLLRDPIVCGRSDVLSNLTLAPGETKEVLIDLGELNLYRTFYDGSTGHPKLQEHRNRALVSDRWIDIVAHVSYRDANGFVQQRNVAVALGQ